MSALRDTIRRELGAEPLAKHGANQHTSGVDNIKSSQGGDNPSYLTARLQRDRPDLAERVLAQLDA